VAKIIHLFAIAIAVVASPYPTQAQQATGKIPRIGFLEIRSSNPKAFWHGLRDLGYVEGRNIEIEYRSAQGDIDQLAPLAAELVSLKVDIIVTNSGQGALRAKKATSTIPIVMTNSADAVRQHIVASLARPGGNVTGLTSTTPDLTGKRLELLKQVFPNVSRMGFMWCHGFSPFSRDSGPRVLKETRVVARALGVELLSIAVREPGDSGLTLAFKEATTKRVEALLYLIVLQPFRRHRLSTSRRRVGCRRCIPTVITSRNLMDSWHTGHFYRT